MTAVEIAAVAQPIVAAVVGSGQIAVIWFGIRAMIAANNDRAAGAAEAARRADARHAEAARHADERHAQAMAAHAETMAAHAETMAAHAETMATLEAQRIAMAALIERTAPPAPAPRFRRRAARVR